MAVDSLFLCLIMKYNININQKAIVDLGLNLDVVDAAIIDFLNNFAHSRACKNMNDSGHIYYWFSWKIIVQQLPILNIKTKQGVYKRLQKLQEAGIVVRHDSNMSSKMSWFRFGENNSKLQFTTVNESLHEPETDVYGATINESLRYNNTILDNSIKDNKKEKAASLDSFEIEKEKERNAFQASFEKKEKKVAPKKERKTPEQRQAQAIDTHWQKLKSFQGKAEAKQQFKELWEVYDKKNYHKEAINQFAKLYKEGDLDFQELISHVKEYKQSTEKRYRLNLSNYLKQEVYLYPVEKESKNGVLESKQSPTKLAGFRINR